MNSGMDAECAKKRRARRVTFASFALNWALCVQLRHYSIGFQAKHNKEAKKTWPPLRPDNLYRK
jgi:hypothetical protein